MKGFVHVDNNCNSSEGRTYREKGHETSQMSTFERLLTFLEDLVELRNGPVDEEKTSGVNCKQKGCNE